MKSLKIIKNFRSRFRDAVSPDHEFASAILVYFDLNFVLFPAFDSFSLNHVEVLDNAGFFSKVVFWKCFLGVKGSKG